MSAARPTNKACVTVRKGPLVGPVLGRVVGMLAARAQCPIDRLDDAMLLTDAVAAHAPAHTDDAHVRVVVAADEGGLELRVGSLARDGASDLLADAELPGVGNVFERVADEVDARGTGNGGELVLRLRFAAA
jgi:serine/threonine-protein kinase RsbW